MSVMAVNEHGESHHWPPDDAEPDPLLHYTIRELEAPAPEDIRVEVSVEEDGGLVADIVWSDDEAELEDGGWRVYVTSPVVTQMDKLIPQVNTSEFRVELRDSHPLSEISILRYELEMTSNKSAPVPLFRCHFTIIISLAYHDLSVNCILILLRILRSQMRLLTVSFMPMSYGTTEMFPSMEKLLE